MFGNAPRSRLLPMSVPFRFFGAAMVFQVIAWAVLLGSSRQFLEFEGGLGPVFAALHLLTIGVLAMAAAGATLQLLPVATRQPVRSLGAAKLVWWLLAPGIVAFAYGAATYDTHLMHGGALAAAVAFVLYGYLFFGNLLHARGLPAVVAHGWAALACLAAFAATGVALVAHYEHGLALDVGAMRVAHLVLASYGFMGLLALGLSTFLLPMLALAPPPAQRGTYGVLAAAAVGIVLALLGWRLAGALVGLAACAAHVFALERSLRSRLRAPLGTAFFLIRVSWGLLIAGLALAALMEAGLAPARASLLFGVLLLPGWLLTFLLGVLQRILPFLASVHATKGPQGTPLLSTLTPARLLGVHALLHLGALCALAASVLFGQAAFATLGAALGLTGAVAYAGFFAFVILKVRHHGIQPPHQPAPA